MNELLLDSIDKIEMSSLFSEMEVLASLMSVYEKQKVIIENAINPADFTDLYVMEADGSKESPTDKKEDETKDVKAVWLKKLGMYLKKFFAFGIRLIERFAKSINQHLIEKRFKTAAASARVPKEVKKVIRNATVLILIEYSIAVTYPLAVKNDAVYKWCDKSMKEVSQPNFIDKYVTDPSYKITHMWSDRPEVSFSGKLGEFVNQLNTYYRKLYDGEPGIPECAQVLNDFGGHLKHYQDDIKIAELKELDDTHKNKARYKDINNGISSLFKLACEHGKAVMDCIKTICDLVKDEKEVNMTVVSSLLAKGDTGAKSSTAAAS